MPLSEDTKRIYESEDYLKNRAAVFHSNFVSTGKPGQGVKSVPVGHYVLPHDSIQNVSEEQISTEESEESLSDKTEDQTVREKNRMGTKNDTNFSLEPAHKDLR
ncbi:telomere repeats-binding bouquet formation protein 2-like [Carassius auratus]|uniref:Telomere repeats-binding bouquet formation protein 2-like n=1 Tax=Carassius auratus TaxID=7957 RepID=A0A6P6KK65_CARAU|nr:telomere repeats-binding bouquet formation protein 2-like [Carassius auratus]